MLDVNGADMSPNLWISQIMSCVVYAVILIVGGNINVWFTVEIGHFNYLNFKAVGLADTKFPKLGRRMMFLSGMAICFVGSAMCAVLQFNVMQVWILFDGYVQAMLGTLQSCSICKIHYQKWYVMHLTLIDYNCEVEFQKSFKMTDRSQPTNRPSVKRKFEFIPGRLKKLNLWTFNRPVGRNWLN
jgi:hypothetical protein